MPAGQSDGAGAGAGAATATVGPLRTGAAVVALALGAPAPWLRAASTMKNNATTDTPMSSAQPDAIMSPVDQPPARGDERTSGAALIPGPPGVWPPGACC